MRNSLSRKEMRDLEDLVSSHSKDILAGKWTEKSFAEFATRKMGRPVTFMNVKGAAKTMEVNFCSGRTSNLSSIRELRAAVKILAQELVSSHGQLGIHISPILQSLAGVDSKEEGDDNGSGT